MQAGIEALAIEDTIEPCDATICGKEQSLGKGLVHLLKMRARCCRTVSIWYW